MPKKKASKKGAKIIDGVATNEMTREQLMGHVKRMQMELNREREERNFFMLEREKLYALWNITLEQLASAKTETRLADVRMDENERDREREMHIYKQKLRFLMTEQSRRVSEVRLHNLQKLKQVQEDMWSVQGSMRQTVDRKNREVSKNQTSMLEMMRQLQLANSENSSKLREDFCTEIRRMESTYERLMFEREKAQYLHECAEIQRTNLEKSEHVQLLINLHEKQMSQIKEYFNEITANNFAVISALQEEIEQMREKEDELKTQVVRGRRDYKRLEDTILKGKAELDQRLNHDRKGAQEIKQQLDRCGKRLDQNDRYARMLEVSNEALIQKAELARKEKDALKSTFTRTIVDMQKKAGMKRLLLGMKLSAMARPQSESDQDGNTRTGQLSQQLGKASSVSEVSNNYIDYDNDSFDDDESDDEVPNRESEIADQVADEETTQDQEIDEVPSPQSHSHTLD